MAFVMELHTVANTRKGHPYSTRACPNSGTDPGKEEREKQACPDCNRCRTARPFTTVRSGTITRTYRRADKRSGRNNLAVELITTPVANELIDEGKTK